MLSPYLPPPRYPPPSTSLHALTGKQMWFGPGGGECCCSGLVLPQFTDEETEAPAKGGVGASGPVSDQHLLRGLWTRIRSASPPPRRPWYSWRPPLRTRPAGGGRSGGSWMHAEASAASAWVAIWNSGASSRSSWASPCTRSWPSSCWTG